MNAKMSPLKRAAFLLQRAAVLRDPVKARREALAAHRTAAVRDEVEAAERIRSSMGEAVEGVVRLLREEAT